MVKIPDDALYIVRSHVSKKPEGMWREDESRPDGLRFIHALYPLSVISSVAIEKDDRRWLHVSFAHAKRIPNYEEIQKVKKDFIGEDKYAVMVFPEKDKYVNIHPYCLHLWHCLDGHPLPEFSNFIPGTETRTL